MMPNYSQGWDLADTFPVPGKVGKGEKKSRSTTSAPSNEAPSFPSLGFEAQDPGPGWEEWLTNPNPGNAKTKRLNGLQWHSAF